MGTMTVSAGTSAEGTESFSHEAMVPQGRLYVPPAYAQTSGDAALALTSGNHKVALGFTPEIDFALDALSFYVTAIGATGEVSIDLHADGSALEPNGDLNSSSPSVAPVMTANNAPSPYAVGLRDSVGANAEASGFEAYKAMDNTRTSNTGVRSTVAPTIAAPLYYTIDLGPGNARTINRFRFYPFMNSDTNVRALPRAWTFWGSNVESPVVNTDADWTPITGSAAWTAVPDFAIGSLNAFEDYSVTNGSAFRHYRWKFTDRTGTNPYLSIGEIQLFEPQTASAAGALVQSLGAATVGSSADAWVRHTFEPYQLRRGTKYWLVFSGQAAKDFSLSIKRNSTAAGSMFPDSCETKQTTDGTVWTQSRQNLKPAMLNVVLNSTPHHCPQLMYGRSSGRLIPLYNGSSWSPATIPEAGIACYCEALLESTVYSVYAYAHEDEIMLEASVTPRGVQDGVEVKSNDPSRRFVGVLGVDNVQGGYQGPVDTPDARLVRNRYNPWVKKLTKDPNYVAYTRADHYGNAWVRLNNNDDFKMRFVSWEAETILYTCTFYVNSAYNWIWSIAADRVCPQSSDVFGPDIGGPIGGVVAPTFSLNVPQGYHSAWPVVSSLASQLTQFYLTAYTSPYPKSVCISAAIPC